MSLKEHLNGLIRNSLTEIAPILAGVVVAFDHETSTATVRCTHRSGRGFEHYELPWPKSASGAFFADPHVEGEDIPGTHVTIGFRGADWNYPVLLSAYDPMHESVTRQAVKRSLSSYTTKADKAITSKL